MMFVGNTAMPVDLKEPTQKLFRTEKIVCPNIGNFRNGRRTKNSWNKTLEIFRKSFSFKGMFWNHQKEVE